MKPESSRKKEKNVEIVMSLNKESNMYTQWPYLQLIGHEGTDRTGFSPSMILELLLKH